MSNNAPSAWYCVEHKRYPVQYYHVKATNAKDAINQVLAYEPRLKADDLIAKEAK